MMPTADSTEINTSVTVTEITTAKNDYTTLDHCLATYTILTHRPAV